MKIKKNLAKCLLCGDTLESVYDGQRETCECGNLTIDGGLEYLVRLPLNGDHMMEELAEMESELAGITPLEVIPFGTVEDFRGILSVSQFYDKLGLLARLESGEIPKVSQLWMNPTDHKALAKIILKELLRKKHDRWFAPDIRRAAMMDWLNLSPQSDDQVPQGDLWWVKEHDKGDV